MSNDFSQARSALAGALNVAGPILTALQQADVVFGVLANAEKHKRMLETEVADYKAELDKTKNAINKSGEKLKAVLAEIGVAETEADARIKAVIADETAQVAAAKAAAAVAKGEYAKATSDIQAAHLDAVAKAQKASADVVAELAAKEAGLNTSITALEKKLDALRANAQKFAAALTAE